MTETVLAFIALFALIFWGVPIGFAMGGVGAVGFAAFVGWQPTGAMVGQIITDNVFNYGFSLLPLFVLMGNLITNAKLSDELYAASNAVLGHLRGGLAMSTILACGGFSAVCGSSMATAATMAKVAMPQMRHYGYDSGLAAASIAAGGTLGILIPPSAIMVIYGFMTDTDIGKLFIAGLIPGALGIVFYLIAVWVSVLVNPGAAGRGSRSASREIACFAGGCRRPDTFRRCDDRDLRRHLHASRSRRHRRRWRILDRTKAWHAELEEPRSDLG